MISKSIAEKIGFTVLGLCGLMVVLTLFGILWNIVYNGLRSSVGNS